MTRIEQIDWIILGSILDIICFSYRGFGRINYKNGKTLAFGLFGSCLNTIKGEKYKN